MKTEQIPNHTSKLVAYDNAVIKALESDVGDIDNETIFGGTCKDGKWTWLVRGQSLEVIHTSTGERQAAWCFGDEKKVTVSCVKEYSFNNCTKLLVGLKLGSEGMLCVFDPSVSKVTIAVSIPHKVSSIEPITNVGGIRAPNYLLCPHLQLFFGIVAVGTERGYVYLIDMRLDEVGELSDESSPSGIHLISARASQDVAQNRLKAARRGEHLAMLLDETSHKRSSFNFRSQDGDTIRSYYASEVAVTALHFVKQIGGLAVGFSFGCFQLWDLIGPFLDYSSPLEKNSSSVTHFAYQEPDDDPRHFCFMWLSKGPLCTDSSQEVPVTLYLFQLSFDAKDNHEQHGHLYKGLQDCTPRFVHSVTADVFNDSDSSSVGSRMFSCYTLENELTADMLKHEDSLMEDGATGNRKDLSLTLFAWEAPSGGQGSPTSCFLALFDLNRWYHAQMPKAVSQSRDAHEICSYFSFCSLESVMESAAPDVLLDVYVKPHNVAKFKSAITPAPEQHFYPSALSFTASCVMETGVVRAEFLGSQRQALANIGKVGPQILQDPKEYFNLCWIAGLLPRNMDHLATGIPVQLQRDALLTVALENNMVDFLIVSITVWSEGGFSSGCTLRTILDWAWNKVASIKESIDRVCMPLYDGYGTHLDKQSTQLLDQHALHLNHMVLIFQALLDQSGTTTEQGLRDLETKLNVVTLICQHLHIVIWFVRNHLLPEYPDDLDDPLPGQFCYPSMLLRQAYTNRRAELQRLCGPTSDSDILMIDGMVSQIGQSLQSLWSKEEGGTGRFPPPSLHAVLDMYLLEGVEPLFKHCVVTYLLLDIASLVSGHHKEKFIDQIGQFPQSFSLPLGVTKLVQGFWLLDHKDFGEALNMLLDPLITFDLAPWQHSRIVRGFLYQGESNKALQYIRTKQPALDSLEDVKLHLSVLLSNGLTAEAFQFQRLYRDQENSEELLYHLFLGAQQTKTVDNLLKLPLSQLEESTLVTYLKESTEPNSMELLVMHYLQQARYVEAIRLNETLKHGLMSETDGKARERASARNAIVDSYAKLLPQVQRKLAFGPEQPKKRMMMKRQEVTRPKPLSTVVNRSNTGQAISRATLLNAVLDKISEARSQPREETPVRKRLSDIIPTAAEPDPFVATPLTPRSKGVPSENRSLVYPTVCYPEDTPLLKVASPVRQRPYGSPQQMNITDLLTPATLIDRMKRRTLDYTGAQALSLLQTPPVKRRTPGSSRQTDLVIPQPTPQSILKVRKTIKRSPSPTKERQRSPSPVKDEQELKPKQLSSVFAGDIKLETPPRFQRKVKKATFVFDDEPEKTETPRHIRFAEGTKDVTPSPTEEVKSSIPDEPKEESMPLVEDEKRDEISLGNEDRPLDTTPDDSLDLRLDDSYETMAVDDEITFDFHRRGDHSAVMQDDKNDEEEVKKEEEPPVIAIDDEEEEEVSMDDGEEYVSMEAIEDNISMEEGLRERTTRSPSPKKEPSPEVREIMPHQEPFTEGLSERTPSLAEEMAEEQEDQKQTLIVGEPSPLVEQSAGKEPPSLPQLMMKRDPSPVTQKEPSPIRQASPMRDLLPGKDISPERDSVSEDVVTAAAQKSEDKEGAVAVSMAVPEEKEVEMNVEHEGESPMGAEMEEEALFPSPPRQTQFLEMTPPTTPEVSSIATVPIAIVQAETEDHPGAKESPRRTPSPERMTSRSTLSETAVQTTPGLALRQPTKMSTPSYEDAFKASLRSTGRGVGRRRRVEESQQDETQEAKPLKAPSPPEIRVETPSLSDTQIKEEHSDNIDDSVQDVFLESTTATDSGAFAIKKEPMHFQPEYSEDEPLFNFSKPTPVVTGEDTAPDTPSGTTATPKFVFSPPLTRSQLRRKQKSHLTPDMSGLQGESPGLLPPSTESIKQEKKTESLTTKRVTRSRKSTKLSSLPPSDSPINFISPVIDDSKEQTQRRLTRRSARSTRSSVTVQSQSQEKQPTRRAKTRSGKLWSYDV
ncbi:protein ELYS-like [Ptychodera flava]|uniref:protein ELYS-like n=1 Tax=Ptychodera flava TaxID=63121 RepID=UPI00396AA091